MKYRREEGRKDVSKKRRKEENKGACKEWGKRGSK